MGKGHYGSWTCHCRINGFVHCTRCGKPLIIPRLSSSSFKIINCSVTIAGRKPRIATVALTVQHRLVLHNQQQHRSLMSHLTMYRVSRTSTCHFPRVWTISLGAPASLSVGQGRRSAPAQSRESRSTQLWVRKNKNIKSLKKK